MSESNEAAEPSVFLVRPRRGLSRESKDGAIGLSHEKKGNNMTTGCVILAGGRSSRMGTDKALLPIDNENFISKLMDEFSFFKEKIISRGEQDEIPGITWPMFSDLYPNCGPIGGLHAALSICHSEALFFVACDTPFLKANVFWKLEERMRPDVDAVIAVTEDGRYHPLCGIYKKYISELLEEQIKKGDNRIMSVLKKIRVEYVELSSFEYGIYNINTPKDYALHIKEKIENPNGRAYLPK